MKQRLWFLAAMVGVWAVVASGAVVASAIWSHWGRLTPGIWWTIAADSFMPLGGVYSGVIFAACLLYWWATYRADKPQ